MIMYSVRCCFNLALVGATLLGSTQAFTSRLVPSPVRGTRTMALVSFQQQQQQEQPHSMEEIASCALTGLCSVQDMEDMMQGTSSQKLVGWCTDVWRKKRIMTHKYSLVLVVVTRRIATCHYHYYNQQQERDDSGRSGGAKLCQSSSSFGQYGTTTGPVEGGLEIASGIACLGTRIARHP